MRSRSIRNEHAGEVVNFVKGNALVFHAGGVALTATA